jgi:hypothetical protein
VAAYTVLLSGQVKPPSTDFVDAAAGGAALPDGEVHDVRIGGMNGQRAERRALELAVREHLPAQAAVARPEDRGTGARHRAEDQLVIGGMDTRGW